LSTNNDVAVVIATPRYFDVTPTTSLDHHLATAVTLASILAITIVVAVPTAAANFNAYAPGTDAYAKTLRRGRR
jgi:hypothetical protein